jgi:hypothetical protein
MNHRHIFTPPRHCSRRGPALVAALLATLFVSSCGGDESAAQDPEELRRAEFEQVLAEATARAQEAQTLAVDGPCSLSNQCSVLTLDNGLPCGKTSKDYSLASPTASAASAAADEYHRLIRRAYELYPPAPNSGTCFERTQPPLYCVQSKCVRGFIFPPPP